ncbi:MAG: prepilin-type N-terminal cleavage/methylation domain-containing protein [Firmicutes bacterium]|nr:prepilin-type N-terminal cleavage/methylation domain-containing protein [Bacillota bacterium]
MSAGAEKRKSRRGITLIELMVAIAIFATVITITYMSWNVVTLNFNLISAKVDARQKAREGVNYVQQDISMASYIFCGRTVTFGDHLYTIPLTGVSSTNMLIAIPENADWTSYKIVGYYIAAKSPADPANPNAYTLYRQIASGVTEATAGPVQSMDFSKIPATSVSRRVIADYIDATKMSFEAGEQSRYIDIVMATNKRQLTNSKYEPALLELTVSLMNKF